MVSCILLLYSDVQWHLFSMPLQVDNGTLAPLSTLGQHIVGSVTSQSPYVAYEHSTKSIWMTARALKQRQAHSLTPSTKLHNGSQYQQCTFLLAKLVDLEG